MAFKRKKIKQAVTIGNRLKQARRKNKLTLEQAEEQTKVRIKYLQAIEQDNWNIFPNKVYVLGFVRRYARFIGLDEDKIVEEFKREFGEYSTHVKVAEKERWLDRIVITPKLLITFFSSLAVLAIIGYIIFSAKAISKPPEIEILSPATEAVTQREITIEGKTSSTAIVEINNQMVSVDDSGYFSQKVNLSEGINNFTIKSKNRIGRENTRELKLFYSPNPLPSATKT